MKYNNIFFAIIFIILYSSHGKSQEIFYPQKTRIFQLIDTQTTIRKTIQNHKSIQLPLYSANSLQTFWKYSKSLIYWKRKAFYEQLINVSKKDLKLYGNYLLHFSTSIDKNSKTNTIYTTNTRGLRFYGSIGKKLSFYTEFYENQSFFPQFIQTFIDSTKVIPGQGRTKSFRTTGYDYALSQASISYTPHKNISFYFGNHKLKIGNGYRSLLLSNHVFNYPFLQSQIRFLDSKFVMQSIWTKFQILNRIPTNQLNQSVFQRKNGSFHYLNYAPNSKFEIGLFEGVIWKRWNTNTQSDIKLPISFYMPIPFLSNIIYSADSNVNPSFGINIRYSLNSSLQFYHQLIWNRMQNTKGLQIGFKYQSFFLKNLNLQVEYNTVEKNTSITQQTLDRTHYGENIGHPLGNNIQEIVSIMEYSYKRFYVQGKINLFSKQKKGNIFYTKWGYTINKTNQLQIYFDYLQKDFDQKKLQTKWFQIGIQTYLTTFFYDY